MCFTLYISLNPIFEAQFLIVVHASDSVSEIRMTLMSSLGKILGLYFLLVPIFLLILFFAFKNIKMAKNDKSFCLHIVKSYTVEKEIL